jgi:hypothetical protein
MDAPANDEVCNGHDKHDESPTLDLYVLISHGEHTPNDLVYPAIHVQLLNNRLPANDVE